MWSNRKSGQGMDLGSLMDSAEKQHRDRQLGETSAAVATALTSASALAATPGSLADSLRAVQPPEPPGSGPGGRIAGEWALPSTADPAARRQSSGERSTASTGSAIVSLSGGIVTTLVTPDSKSGAKAAEGTGAGAGAKEPKHRQLQQSRATGGGGGGGSATATTSGRNSVGRGVGGHGLVSDDDGEGLEEYVPPERPNISMVIVGHVDAGKSTLMGQLLWKLGCVEQRILHKYKRDSQVAGKSSFYLAWIMDEDGREREHGVTIDVAHKQFRTEHRTVTVLDAPGHQDFIPNMIAGTAQADVALLVVPATPSEFESAFGPGAQTREHALLLRAMGVNQVLCVVNKLDAAEPTWSQDRFLQVRQAVEEYLFSIGFRREQLRFIPVSGLVGENVLDVSAECPLREWYGEEEPTLLQAIDSFPIPKRPIRKPLRAFVVSLWNSSKSGAQVVVRVVQGRLRAGTHVALLPWGCLARVRSIEHFSGDEGETRYTSRTDRDLHAAYAGELVRAILSGVESNMLSVGTVLVKGPALPMVSRNFSAQIHTLSDITLPIVKGCSLQLHAHVLELPCHILRIDALVHPNGTVIRRKPKVVPPGQNAIVRIRVEQPVCIETFAACRPLGRVVFRLRGSTVAVGIVVPQNAAKAGTTPQQQQSQHAVAAAAAAGAAASASGAGSGRKPQR